MLARTEEQDRRRQTTWVDFVSAVTSQVGQLIKGSLPELDVSQIVIAFWQGIAQSLGDEHQIASMINFLANGVAKKLEYNNQPLPPEVQTKVAMAFTSTLRELDSFTRLVILGRLTRSMADAGITEPAETPS